jgi:hypothetical protein
MERVPEIEWVTGNEVGVTISVSVSIVCEAEHTVDELDLKSKK